VSEHEHADRASLSQADTRAHSDHLPFNPGLDARLHVLEGLTANTDWPELRKVHEAIATHDEREIRILAAIQLHVELVARTYNIVRGHGHIGRRGERRDLPVEQLVAEGLQRGDTDLLQREFGDADKEI